MYNLRLRDKSNYHNKYYEKEEDSPRKSIRKTKGNKNQKKSTNMKSQKIDDKYKHNSFFSFNNLINEKSLQIKDAKIKTKKFHENKFKENIKNYHNKKNMKRKKEKKIIKNMVPCHKIEKYLNIEINPVKENENNKIENKKRLNTVDISIDENKKFNIKNEKSIWKTVKKIKHKGENKKIIWTPDKNNIRKKTPEINDNFGKKTIGHKSGKNNKNKYNFNKNYKNQKSKRKNVSSFNFKRNKVILDDSDLEAEKVKQKNLETSKGKEKNNNVQNQKNKNNKNHKIKKNQNDKVINKNLKNEKNIMKEKKTEENNLKKKNNEIDKYFKINELINNNNIYFEKCNYYSNNINSDIIVIKKKIFNRNIIDENSVNKYKFYYCEANIKKSIVILKFTPKEKENKYKYNSNDIEIIIEDDRGNVNCENFNKNLLGHKRRRSEKEKKIKKENDKLIKENKKGKKEKETKIKKEKNDETKKPKKIQNNKNENKKTKKSKQKYNNINEINQLKNDLSYNSSSFSNNIKKESKTNKSVKKNKEVKKENEELFIENGINSCSSLSDGEKKNKRYNITKNSNKNYKNDYEQNIKSSINDFEIEGKEKFKKEEEQNSPLNSFYKNQVNDNYSSSSFTSHKNNNLINSYSSKKMSYSSSFILENSLDYSFPHEFDEKIQIKEDMTYLTKNSRYIKYHPIDQYTPPIPIDEKKQFKAKIGKTKKINFTKKFKDFFSSDIDNELTDVTSNYYTNDDVENFELFPILCIPRIKPCKEEHNKLIMNKLKHDGIKPHKILTEKIKKDEFNLFLGSFMLYDEKNNIKINVPCYRENEKMKEFMTKKNLRMIEFEEDNDIDTDEEQLGLEVERNNEALLNFMKKVEKERDYVERSLNRKKKV